MIRYHFDLYPRDDPRDGARVVRFTKLQSAEYRGEANGTGAGHLSIRADTTEAQFIDPRGLQYVRVVREDTVAATEVVVGGFFLDSGDFTALDERGTRLLKFGGAGTLSYLSRAIMASHTYISSAGYVGQDPFDDTWRLHAQWDTQGISGDVATGPSFGGILWRVIYEAQHNTPGTHKHADGVNVSDTHSDDRPVNALPALTLGFDWTRDSNGNLFAEFAGMEFKAPVGDNVLAVVKRLMEAGLYVSMDPDTFELDAYPAATHRRTRTGVAWGTNVIRFQAPTDGTTATGNIKSDAKRAIAAFVKRSWLLAGGQDVYGDATGTTDIPWEGFYASDTEEVAALNQIAGVQVGARDDAGDTLRLRIKLGTTPASGTYLPFEHILLDDLVTVHTGTGQWDYNEQAFPVAAMTVVLRIGGDWDCWVELGSSYGAASSRQFQVSPVAAHNHTFPFCIPGTSTPPTIADSGHGSSTSSTLGVGLTVDSGLADPAIYVAIKADQQTVSPTLDDILPYWRPAGTNVGEQALTKIAEMGTGTARTQLWRLLNPTPSSSPSSGIHTASVYMTALGAWAVGGVNQSDPEGTPQTASGTSAASSIAVGAAASDLTLDFAGSWFTSGAFADPTDAGDQTLSFASTADALGARIEYAGGYGGSAPSWSFGTSRDWTAVAVAVHGTSSGDGTVETVGTEPRAARCDHKHYHSELLARTAVEAHPASSVSVTPFSTIAATDVQAALEEIVAEAGSGVTDHGALTGLADDDHTQYLTEARHAALSHETLGHWEPVTNGDTVNPEIVFDAGDVVLEWTT